MTLEGILALAGFGVTLLVYGVAIIRYILDKVEEKHRQGSEAQLRLESEIRKDLKEIGDNYVRRDDHARHVESVERQINGVTITMNSMNKDITGRLDNLMAMIATLVVGKK